MFYFYGTYFEMKSMQMDFMIYLFIDQTMLMTYHVLSHQQSH